MIRPGPTPRRLRAAILGCLVAAAAPAMLHAAPMPAGVERHLGLAELGYPEGLLVEGLGATRDLFLPLPDVTAIESARLVLRLESHSLFPGRRGVEVLANGRPVLTRALADDTAQAGAEIVLTAEDLARGNGFLRLTIRSIGAMTDWRCVDLRLAGERLVLLPSSRLELRLAGGAELRPGALFRLLPRDVTVVTRAGPLSAEEAAAALTAAQAIATSGRRVSFAARVPAEEDGVWRRGAVLVGAADGRDGDGQIDTALAGGRPALVVRGARPDLAARLLVEPWREAAVPGTEVGAAAAEAPPRQASIPLTTLRGSLAAAEVIDRGSWSVDFAARDLPPGQRPARIALDIAAAPDLTGERPVVSVFVNDVLIGGEPLGADGPTRMVLPIPAGLSALDNQIRIVAQRRPRGGNCETLPAPLPVQILPSSRLELSPAPAVADFHEQATRFHDAATILTDIAPDQTRLALMFALLRTQVRTGAALTVQTGQRPPDGQSFLAFTDAPPEGIRPPPIRFDRGRLRFDGRDGRVLFDISGAPESLVAQLVTGPGGGTGIWVRPPSDPAAVPATLALDRGNVAFADGRGILLAWATGRDRLVEVNYLDHQSLWASVDRYRPWLVGAVWLGVTATAGAGFSLSRARRRRRAAERDDG